MYQSFNDNKFVSETDAAEFLGLKRQTLANWRHKRKGPPYHKFSTRVLYAIPDLLIYRQKHRIDPEKNHQK